MAMGRGYKVSHRISQDLPYSLMMENTRNPDEFLLFESGVAASLKCSDCVDLKKNYTKLLDAYGSLGVLQFYGEKTVSYLAMVSACVSVGKIDDCDIYRLTGIQFLPMWKPLATGANAHVDDRIVEIQKVLVASGSFYFSWSSKQESLIDLSLSAQERLKGVETDTRFFWNRNLLMHMQRFGIDTKKWAVCLICGGVEIRTVYVGRQVAKVCVISRLSCERAGTRFNVRGTNDYGHVANFVETEQVIFAGDSVTSFLQTRGSVPLFWEQPGVQVGAHKVKLSRGMEASAPAYDRHFRMMKERYGRVSVANLLGSKEGEASLSKMFQEHHRNSSHRKDVPFVNFDYHARVRATGNKTQLKDVLWTELRDKVSSNGFFVAIGGEIKQMQTGVVRTNCLDCLDRTNTVQAFFASILIQSQLTAIDLDEKTDRFVEALKQLWENNGNHVSTMYAGTGALEFRSKFKDGARSVTRTIQNNLMDGSKQEAIDCFLLGSGLNTDLYDRCCNLLPTSLLHGATIASACPNVLRAMVERSDEYTVPRKFRVFCGTWNVNGGTRFDDIAFKNETLKDWLINLHLGPDSLVDMQSNFDTSTPVDIYCIGFEEIVDLSAGNIVSASSSNQRRWEEKLRKEISESNKYIIITSLQLVGVCMFVFVRPHLAPFIRDVAVDSVKTGLGGATGNKGAVAVRFVLHGTSLCFLCGHFAAGQSHVKERNSDYAEICRMIKFPMGRSVFSHDLVFWVGDFNYRIDMSGDKVKQLVAENRIDLLVEADQLTQQRLPGNEKVFHGFREGPLHFAPTYKYDLFSDDYDTSDKCRCPAWTDRVLWWQRPPLDCDTVNDPDSTCRLLIYQRSELKTSDHRPVGAFFDVHVSEVNEVQRDETYRSVVECMGPPDSTLIVQVPLGVSLDEFIPAVLDKCKELCTTLRLYLIVANEIWLMFKDGENALAALSICGTKVCGNEINAYLRSPRWELASDLELSRVRKNTVALYSNETYNLLAENLGDSLVGLQFEDEDNELVVDDNITRLTTATSQNATPNVSGRNTPTQAPPRPAAPPKRPPPPRSMVVQPAIIDTDMTRTGSTPNMRPPLPFDFNAAWGETNTAPLESQVVKMESVQLQSAAPPPQISHFENGPFVDWGADDSGIGFSAPPDFGPPPQLPGFETEDPFVASSTAIPKIPPRPPNYPLPPVPPPRRLPPVPPS